jgi:DNA-binding beta-propeller fold protein YncE
MRVLAVSLFVIAFCTGNATAQPHPSLTLQPIGNYRTGVFSDGASEIVAYDAFTRRIFSVNAHAQVIDVISLQDPVKPALLFSIDLLPYGKKANSVAVCNGILAAAVENENEQEPGRLALFSTWGNCSPINDFEIGAKPDMVTFSPNGHYILVANKGDPNADYTIDPEGSISIADLRFGPLHTTVTTVSFTDFNDRKEELQASGVRIFGPNASVAQDLEPEYITISDNSKRAWVTLQDNNAIAVIDIKNGSVDTIIPLGYKDYLDPANKFDASDKDAMVNINNWPVYGLYLPDGIASYSVCGKTYLITANEGETRSYDGFDDEKRVAKLSLDPTAFPYANELQKDNNLGRLKVTKTLGDIDGDGDYDQLYAFGGRSFAIWSDDGSLIYESGSLLESITAEYFPDDFNANDEENESFDSRSDDKGPEPENVTIGKIFGKTYAFIGLERIGGIMIFDVSNPCAPIFQDYITTRIFSGNPQTDSAGDLAPEGLLFVPAVLSPTFKPLIIASYEMSGSVTIFEVAWKGVPPCKHQPRFANKPFSKRLNSSKGW